MESIYLTQNVLSSFSNFKAYIESIYFSRFQTEELEDIYEYLLETEELDDVYEHLLDSAFSHLKGRRIECKGVIFMLENNTDIGSMDEIQLARLHMESLENENYELCNQIQREVDERIRSNKINSILLEAYLFRSTISSREDSLNGLFKNYKRNT